MSAPLRKIHSVAEAIPRMSDDQFARLVVDIRSKGLKVPILVHPEDGNIIDGRHRYEACLELGVEPEFKVWDERGSLPGLVMSLNVMRRHLSQSNRSLLAAKFAPMFEDEARTRQLSGKRDLAADLQQGRSAKKAADAAGVSERLVYEAVKVLRDGEPELVAAIEADVVSVTTAAKLTGLPRKEQVAASKSKKASIEAARKADETKAQAEADAAPPSKRQQITATADKKRMGAALSAIAGAIKGLSGLDIAAVRPLCSTEEVRFWCSSAEEFAQCLTALRSGLQGGEKR